jgi:hypothetical protein
VVALSPHARRRRKEERHPPPGEELSLLCSEDNELIADGIRQGLNISKKVVSAEEDEADSSLHHDLGLHPSILDAVIAEILETPVRPYFSGQNSGARKIKFLP